MGNLFNNPIQKAIVICFLLFSVSPILIDITLNFNGFLYSLFYLLSRLSLILLSFLILNSIVNFKAAVYIMAVFFVIVVPVEMVHLLVFNDYMTRQGIIAVAQTNYNESVAFIRGIEWIIVIVISLLLFFLISFRKLPTFRLNFLKPKIIAAFFVLTAMTFTSLIGQLKTSADSSGKRTFYLFKREIVKKHPLNLVYRCYESYAYFKAIDDYRRDMAHFRFQSIQNREFSSGQIYVMIIGESARAANYQICGYQRETNPRLSLIENLVVFNDFYATANVTTLAVPLMITRATSDNFDLCHKEKSIVSLFSEAGFTSYWISNQEIFKGYGSDKYLDEIDNYYSQTHKNPDEHILPVLDEVLSDTTNDKKLIIINLFGNHYGINSHPQEYNVFSPNLEQSNAINRNVSNRELFINSYDNSVLYQDYVLSEIIKHVDARESVSMVYFSSDHGESLFDEPSYFYGHGASTITKEQVHVPAFVWYSSLYEVFNSDLVVNLRANMDKRLSADNTFYTFAQLASVDFPQFVDSLSFADKNFKEPAERKAIVDYVTVSAEFK